MTTMSSSNRRLNPKKKRGQEIRKRRDSGKHRDKRYILRGVRTRHWDPEMAPQSGVSRSAKQNTPNVNIMIIIAIRLLLATASNPTDAPTTSCKMLYTPLAERYENSYNRAQAAKYAVVCYIRTRSGRPHASLDRSHLDPSALGERVFCGPPFYSFAM